MQRETGADPSRVTLTLEGFHCLRCDHEWVPRGTDEPVICPKCKSAYWNKPRRIRGDQGTVATTRPVPRKSSKSK